MFNTKEEFKYEFSKRIIESYGRTVEELGYDKDGSSG